MGIAPIYPPRFPQGIPSVSFATKPYLPKKAREALTDRDHDRTTAQKRRDTRKGKQHSAQPADVARKTAPFRHGDADLTKAELLEMARAKGVKGRSTMNKAALIKALQA